MLSFIASVGWYWLLLPVALAVFGILLFVGGVGHVFRGRAGRGSARAIIGAPVALVGVAGSFLGLNFQTYSRLTYEAPVAEVSVAAVNPAQSIYNVTVKHLDGPGETITCRLQGDEWALSARVQKWKPWANILGLDTTYTLDQIQNKYRDALHGNGKTITACDLTAPPPPVNEYVPRSWLFWVVKHSYTEDRNFGSAAYMPLRDGARYKVIMTQSGLNAEPDNAGA